MEYPNRITVRLTDKELERLEKLAGKWTKGNVSRLIRLWIWFLEMEKVKNPPVKGLVNIHGQAICPRY